MKWWPFNRNKAHSYHVTYSYATKDGWGRGSITIDFRAGKKFDNSLSVKEAMEFIRKNVPEATSLVITNWIELKGESETEQLRRVIEEKLKTNV